LYKLRTLPQSDKYCFHKAQLWS